MSDSSPMPVPRHAFETLTPDGVMDALASVGLYGDGRLLALSSYENRVYQLHLEDGQVVRVCAQPEPLLEITAPPALLTWIAWHLGNRHLPVQLLADRLRIRVDHVIEEMIEGLGGASTQISAAFDPEPGAYAGGHAHVVE